MSFHDNLTKILQRHTELSEKLSSGILGEEFVKASKEYTELERVVDKINNYNKAMQDLASAKALAAEAGIDAETLEMANEEVRYLENKTVELEQFVKIALLPKDEADSKGAIIEVRAGTGGEEAALFAANLFAMYQRYAELKGWKFEILAIADTGIGG